MRAQLSEEQVDRLTSLRERLTGAMGTQRNYVTLRSGQRIRPPSWWVDDEEATASTMAAIAELTGG